MNKDTTMQSRERISSTAAGVPDRRNRGPACAPHANDETFLDEHPFFWMRRHLPSPLPYEEEEEDNDSCTTTRTSPTSQGLDRNHAAVTTNYSMRPIITAVAASSDILAFSPSPTTPSPPPPPPPHQQQQEQQQHWVPRIAHHSATPEFARGAVAAATNVLLTFPLNKLISRQAYEGLTWNEALETMRRDGFPNLYRGVAPPLLQRGLSVGVMFGMFDFWHAQLRAWMYGSGVNGRNNYSRDGERGTVMTSSSTTKTMTGIEGSVEQKITNSNNTLAIRSRQQEQEQEDAEEEAEDRRRQSLVWKEDGDWVLRAAAGVVAGSTEGLLAPFERVQTLLQHHRYTHIFQNTWTTAKSISNHGPKEFYRGFSAILLRNAPANALWFSMRDPVREAIPAIPPWEQKTAAIHSGSRRTNSQQLHPHAGWRIFRDFLGGAVLGAGISTLFYPVNVVKSVMQLDIGCYHRSVREAAAAVIRDRGVRGLYRGVHANALRSLLSWGIINSSYEMAKEYLPMTDHHSV